MLRSCCASLIARGACRYAQTREARAEDAAAKKPKRRETAPPQPAPPAPSSTSPIGAFQRGYYLTAFDEATKRVEREERPQAR